MADLTIASGIGLTRPVSPVTTAPVSPTTEAGGKDFKSFLLESLDKVNQLQNEADAGVQKVLTGQTGSRKAGIAFDLLMEIRNKLLDAYGELKQMRV